MRFFDVPTIVFTDANGVSYSVKDIRPISVFQTGNIIDMPKKTDIDELISRKEYYGDNSEDFAYAVVDNNIETVVEADFDFNRLTKISIPVIEKF